jgi:hypothetical protein
MMPLLEKLFPRKKKKAPEKGLFQTTEPKPTYDYTDYVINQKFQSATSENQGEILKYILHIERAAENFFISVGSRFIYIERRPATFTDWFVGYSAIFFAAILSLAFVAYPAVITSVVNSVLFFVIGGLLLIWLAAYRQLKISDWFALLFLSSNVLAFVSLLPAALAGPGVIFSRFFATWILYNTSLALYLSAANFIYLLVLNIKLPGTKR